MTAFDLSPLFRATVGFDRLTRMLEDAARISDASNGYPPYNIEKSGENRYRITLAVAGFAEDDLALQVQEGTLTIEGHRKDPEADAIFLHRGIAGRGFKRQFQLADHVVVENAHLHNGLLVIDLTREVPEAMKPRRIQISTATPTVVDASDNKRIGSGQAAA
jgi:molecular chaperone IbpA